MNRTVKRVATGLGVAAAGAAVVALTAASASAATPDYKVTSNGVATGTSAIDVTNVGNIVFTDQTSTSHPILTCTGLSATGTANNGTHLFNPSHSTTDYAGFVSPTATSITGCSNVTVGATTITPTTTTWSLAVASLTGTTGASGSLVNVSAHLKAATCQFDAVGTIAGSYVNSTGRLTSTAAAQTLTISGVTGTGCTLVKIKNGDKASVTAILQLKVHAAPTTFPQITAP